MPLYAKGAPPQPIDPNESTKLGPTKNNGAAVRTQLRHTFSMDFLTKFAADFKEHGMGAIVQVRQANPAAYLRVAVSILPKVVDMNHTFDLSKLTDKELDVLDGIIAKATADIGVDISRENTSIQ